MTEFVNAFVCYRCGFTTFSESELEEHLKEHEQEKINNNEWID